MVSVAELLNPEPPRAPLPTSRPTPSPPACRTPVFGNEPTPAMPFSEAFRMAENTKSTPRCKVKGDINFAPFEVLDEASLREVRRFQVHPFGSIRDTFERIPYNSGKKDFFSKTGRGGFEAFHYDFKVPGDDTTYTVMWDYNVGLVRMTSFFKCRGYSKTTPARMLNQNPGLKDITYSITGGSIKAQGYWMPFSCAQAICATFCHQIAGALIPIFGPQFPEECIPEKSQGYNNMTINPEIVAQAKRDAATLFRSHPPASLPSPRPSRSVSPQLSHRPSRVLDNYHHHADYDGRLLLSPYTDTEVEYHSMPEPRSRHPYPAALTARRIPTSRPSTAPVPPPALTPLQSPGWIVVNPPPTSHIHSTYHHRTITQLHEELHGLNASANPWLSAIPSSPTPGAATSNNNGNWYPYHPRSHHHHHHQSPPQPTSLPERGLTLAPFLHLKRRFDQLDHHAADADAPYDAGSSHAGSLSASPISVAVDLDDHHQPTSATRSSIQVPTHYRPAATTITAVTAAAVAAGFINDADTNTNTHTTAMVLRRSARAASERDAAMMLMHMRGGRDSEEVEDMPVRGRRDGFVSAVAGAPYTAAGGGGASVAGAGAFLGGAFLGGASLGGASLGGASTAGASTTLAYTTLASTTLASTTLASTTLASTTLASVAAASSAAVGGGGGGGALATPSGSASPAVSGREGRWEDGGRETRSKRRRTVEGA